MESLLQDLMFINDSVFDKPEDAGQVKEEVLNIIHGPKNRECFMVEFPWEPLEFMSSNEPAEFDLSGGGSGGVEFMQPSLAEVDIGMIPQVVPQQAVISAPPGFMVNLGGAAGAGGVNMMAQYLPQQKPSDPPMEQNFDAPQSEAIAMANEPAAKESTLVNIENRPRRNRKKRPPGYYQKVEGSFDEQNEERDAGHQPSLEPEEIVERVSSQSAPVITAAPPSGSYVAPQIVSVAPNLVAPPVLPSQVVSQGAVTQVSTTMEPPMIPTPSVPPTQYVDPPRTMYSPNACYYNASSSTNPQPEVSAAVDEVSTGIQNASIEPHENKLEIDNEPIQFLQPDTLEMNVEPEALDTKEQTPDFVEAPSVLPVETNDKKENEEKVFVVAENDNNSALPEVETIKVAESVDEESQIELDASLQAPNKPKPVAKPASWAGLFKSNAAAAAGATNTERRSVPQNASAVNNTDNNSMANNNKKDGGSEREDASGLLVPATEDSIAIDLAVHLKRVKLNHRPVPLQLRGLINRGNWCYVNATLQALLACPPLFHLMKSLPSFPALTRGPTSTPVIDCLVDFFNAFSTMQVPKLGPKDKKSSKDIQAGTPFEPVNVYKMLQRLLSTSAFKHGKQEDAEEFLSTVLNGLHDEMVAALNLLGDDNNTAFASPPVTTNGEAAEEEKKEEQAVDDDEWEQVGPKNKSVVTRKANFTRSPVSDIFCGMFRAALFQHGAKESAMLEPFFTLPLDIQSGKVQTVKDALDGIAFKESLQGFMCSKTKMEVEATRRITLEELPPVLILQLKCFVYDKSGGCQKVIKRVEPSIDLDISKELLSPNARTKLPQNKRSYKLFAVVNHHGKEAVGGGHYTTDIYHPALNSWVRTDDQGIKVISLQQMLRFTPPKVPYLLYYKRCDLIGPQL